jgi:serine/threonine protein phosphatase PrpC
VGRTDTGRKRDCNEDSFLVDDALGLYVVSDGMGGNQAGEVASRMAVEVVARRLGKAKETILRARKGGAATDDVVPLVRKAVLAACREIYAAAEKSESQTGMGCTLTVALVLGDRCVMAHVGDSRLYLMRDGRARQLSEDHTLANELAAEGLEPKAMMTGRFRHMLTREIGTARSVEVDTSCFGLQAGDVLMLCSDGLSNYITSDEWLAEQLHAGSPVAVVDALVGHANASGGEDNVTVVIVGVDHGTTQLAPQDKPEEPGTAVMQRRGAVLPTPAEADAEPATTIFDPAMALKGRDGHQTETGTTILDRASLADDEPTQDGIADDLTTDVMGFPSGDELNGNAQEMGWDVDPHDEETLSDTPLRPGDDGGEIDFEFEALDPDLTAELLSSGELCLTHEGFESLGEAVAAAPLLAGLSTACHDAIIEAARLEELETSQVLLRRGDASPGLYLVIEGRLLRDEEGSAPRKLNPGDHAELSALFADQRCEATLRSSEPTLVLVLEAKPFWDLVRSRRDVGIALVEHFGRELAQKGRRR